MDLPWEQGQRAARTFTRPIEIVARKAVAKMIKGLQTEGLTVKGVGVVGSKDRDLARIGNYHIRAHAAEGILFRRVLELAAEAHGLRTGTFPDRELEATGGVALKLSPPAIKQAAAGSRSCGWSLPGALTRNRQRWPPGYAGLISQSQFHRLRVEARA